MHELSILCHVVDEVTRIASQNCVREISVLVLEVGEFSSVIPRFLQKCYPVAVDGTALQKAKLIIEVLPAHGRCAGCGRVYPITRHGGMCPDCDGGDYEVLDGREFIIKEIVGR